MSKLQKINNALKNVAFPESLRQWIVKFYLLNIRRRKLIYDSEISSEQARNILSVCDVVLNESGWTRSLLASQCVDAKGNPIPWYTFPAIEYLSQLDWSGADVFEFGCGNSTLWWSNRAKSVTSVESDREWFELVKGRIGNNCSVHFETDADRYAEYVSRFDGFDVIVIDGIFLDGGRLKCTERSIESLRPGGLIVLDNSDWLPRSSEILRDSGLIEVDMAGVAPLNIHASTTSLFFNRDFRMKPARKNHPVPAAGGRFAGDGRYHHRP